MVQTNRWLVPLMVLLLISLGFVAAQLVQGADFHSFGRDAIDRAEVVSTGMALTTWDDPPSSPEFRVFYTVFRTAEGIECVAAFPSTRGGDVAGMSCNWP
jgi:hypothetical protein